MYRENIYIEKERTSNIYKYKIYKYIHKIYIFCKRGMYRVLYMPLLQNCYIVFGTILCPSWISWYLVNGRYSSRFEWMNDSQVTSKTMWILPLNIQHYLYSLHSPSVAYHYIFKKRCFSHQEIVVFTFK